MLSKCANPECDAKFLYFHEGHLFVTHGRAKQNPTTGDPAIHPRFFWLCENCSLHMTVQFDVEGMPIIRSRAMTDWEHFSMSAGSQMQEEEASSFSLV